MYRLFNLLWVSALVAVIAFVSFNWNHTPEIPVYPNAQLIEKEEWPGRFPSASISFVTDDNPTKIRAFYIDAMTKLGWDYPRDISDNLYYRARLLAHEKNEANTLYFTIDQGLYSSEPILFLRVVTNPNTDGSTRVEIGLSSGKVSS
jgi:hypothetical protein